MVSLVGEGPRGGGNRSRANRLANPSRGRTDVRASCEATSSFGELRVVQRPARELPNLPISAEVSSCQPVEETDLPAVPVVRPVHEPLHDERSWSHCRQTQSAPLRRARDDHVCDSSRRLRHSAELATSCSPWNPPWEVHQETCMAPSSPCGLICQELLAQNLVSLQNLPGGVQKKPLRIHSALDTMQPLQYELVTIIHDGNSEGVQLDVVALLLGLKHIGGCGKCFTVRWSSRSFDQDL